MSASTSPITIKLTLHVHVHVHEAPAHTRGDEPDATPAGPVVGTRSGVTAGETAASSERPVETNPLIQQTENGASRNGEMLGTRSLGVEAEGERRPQRRASNAHDGGRGGNAAPANAQSVTAGETAPESEAAHEAVHAVSVDAGAGEETSHSADPAPAPPAPKPFSISTPSPADYRPHCRNRDVCAGVGLKHCFACQKIADAALAEAA